MSGWQSDVEADSVDRLSSVRPSIGAGDSGTNIGRNPGAPGMICLVRAKQDVFGCLFQRICHDLGQNRSFRGRRLAVFKDLRKICPQTRAPEILDPVPHAIADETGAILGVANSRSCPGLPVRYSSGDNVKQ